MFTANRYAQTFIQAKSFAPADRVLVNEPPASASTIRLVSLAPPI
jgi:hypothetical protein